jgi:hypothetical protein
MELASCCGECNFKVSHRFLGILCTAVYVYVKMAVSVLGSNRLPTDVNI